MDYIEAANARIPAVGFGTFELEFEDAHRMARHALAVGYRHLDTAQMYRNEEAVGRAVRESGIDLGQIFVTTKIMPDEFRDGDLQRSLHGSLERLGLEQAELVLLIGPIPRSRSTRPCTRSPRPAIAAVRGRSA